MVVLRHCFAENGVLWPCHTCAPRPSKHTVRQPVTPLWQLAGSQIEGYFVSKRNVGEKSRKGALEISSEERSPRNSRGSPNHCLFLLFLHPFLAQDDAARERITPLLPAGMSVNNLDQIVDLVQGDIRVPVLPPFEYSV